MMKRFSQIVVVSKVADLATTLREYDSQGWELVAVTDGSHKLTRILFFKRPLIDVLEKREED